MILRSCHSFDCTSIIIMYKPLAFVILALTIVDVIGRRVAVVAKPPGQGSHGNPNLGSPSPYIPINMGKLSKSYLIVKTRDKGLISHGLDKKQKSCLLVVMA